MHTGWDTDDFAVDFLEFLNTLGEGDDFGRAYESAVIT